MNQKTYSIVSGFIFLVVALLHLVRAVMGSPVSLAGWDVPVWLSWIAVIGAGFLAYLGLRNKVVSVN